MLHAALKDFYNDSFGLENEDMYDDDEVKQWESRATQLITESLGPERVNDFLKNDDRISRVETNDSPRQAWVKYRQAELGILIQVVDSLSRLDIRPDFDGRKWVGSEQFRFKQGMAIKCLSLGNQFRVGQGFCHQEFAERVAEHIRVLSVVVSELQLIKVSVKVLRANLMVATDDGPLEKRPDVLYGVRMHIAPGVLALTMVDPLMLRILVSDPTVGGPLVGVDGLGVAASVRPNEAVQRLPIRTSDNLQADVPAPLHGTHYDGLVAPVASALAVHLAAHERLVHFHYALQELGVNLVESGAYAMAQIPRGLVRYADGALELVGADALFGLYNEVDGKKPLPQRKVRVVKDGASGNGELIAA